jgi:hypothetical protein
MRKDPIDRFSFWQVWLLAVSVIIVVFGLLLALFNQASASS